jgi:hypothetical protein
MRVASEPAARPERQQAGITPYLIANKWEQPVGGCRASGYILHAGSAPGLTDVGVVNPGAKTSLSAEAPDGYF